MGKGKDKHKGKSHGKCKAQGKGSSTSPQKTQDQKESKGGKAQGKGSSQDQEESKGGKAQGKGSSPSPQKGQYQEEDKGRKTAEQVKQEGQKRRVNQTMAERTNTTWVGRYRVPYFHRRNRYPPGKLRKEIKIWIPSWKQKRKTEGRAHQAEKDGFLWSRTDVKFQEEVEKMRKHITEDVFGHILEGARICKDVTSEEGRKEFLEYELWPDGPSWSSLPGLAKPDERSRGEEKGNGKVWDIFVDGLPPALLGISIW